MAYLRYEDNGGQPESTKSTRFGDRTFGNIPCRFFSFLKPHLHLCRYCWFLRYHCRKSPSYRAVRTRIGFFVCRLTMLRTLSSPTVPEYYGIVRAAQKRARSLGTPVRSSFIDWTRFSDTDVTSKSERIFRLLDGIQ